MFGFMVWFGCAWGGLVFWWWWLVFWLAVCFLGGFSVVWWDSVWFAFWFGVL